MHFLSPDTSIDYELIDCGNYRKLERFGELTLDRPEIQANGSPSLPKSKWQNTDWYFTEETGEWISNNGAPKSWFIKYYYKNEPFRFLLKTTSFKHVGLFPEQAVNWQFIQRQLSKIKKEKKVLNLFAYTGAASIIAAKAGAQVTHVDSVRQVINWGKENSKANGVNSIRWIQEDVRKFVDRAIRRKEKYHGIILDPPVFGFGTNNRKWILDRDLMPLLEKIMLLLDKNDHFFILNTYSNKMDFSSFCQKIEQVNAFPKLYEKAILGAISSKSKDIPLGHIIRF